MVAVKNCGTIATGTRNSVIINLIRSVGCLCVSLVVCLTTGFGRMDTAGLFVSVLSGIANGGLLCTWILAASKASLCTVEVFCMTGGVVLPLIISPLIFSGESVSFLQWIGSALLFDAVFCFSKNNGKSKLTVSAIVLLLLACVSNLGCVMTKKLFTSISNSSVQDFQFYTFIFVTLTLFVILALFPKNESEGAPKFSGKVVIYILIAVIMLYSSEYLATLSSGYLSSAIFYPLSYIISMPLTFLIDVVLYKEKITLVNVVGILLVVTSALLINL